MSGAPTGKTTVRLWSEAARPATLGASVVPVLVGTAASGGFIAWRFAAALLVSTSLQVGVNFANDYFDAQKGVDTEARTGPRRVTAAGLIPAEKMRAGIFVCMVVACAAGLALAIAVDLRLLIVGAVCVLAALGYSGGRRPYGAAGLGELFVFVFFGLVATVGSAWVQTTKFSAPALAASVPVGLLATALLVVNNLRDIETDGAAGKRTLAVKLGADRTRLLFRRLISGAFLSLAIVAAAGAGLAALLPLASAPFARPAFEGVRGGVGRELIRVLVATARLELVFGLLLMAGLLTAHLGAQL